MSFTQAVHILLTVHILFILIIYINCNEMVIWSFFYVKVHNVIIFPHPFPQNVGCSLKVSET